jgi:Cu(I)/Ag(I) efflux system membrane fusion protein
MTIDDIQKGQAIEFEMQKTDSGQYEIIDYKVSDLMVASEIWVTGDISMLMADFGMLTVNHTPVPEWGWDAGEMNFSVEESIDLTPFSEGQKIRFLIEKSANEYQLKSLEAAGGNQ